MTISWLVGRKPVINSPLSKQKAFTLIELIVVILLVSIVSVYASSRYFGTDSFSAYAAQDQVISVIRQVQLNQMQSNIDVSVPNNNFTLTITSSCIGSQQACNEQDSNRSDWVSIEGVSFSPQFNQVSFSLLGNPVTPISFDVEAGGISCEVSINAQGYVERGSCS